MTTLAAAAAHDSTDRLLPRTGKVAAERRRRPLTVLFGLFVATIVLCSSSRWPAAGGSREAFFVCGMALACIGAFGRIWSNLFISGYKSKRLITTGPYSICRNPLYFFSAIGMEGIGLATETVSIPLLLLAFFALYYPMIIGREERRLALRHGAAFERYCRETPAFWPHWSRYEEPDFYLMQPRAMLKNLADAFWFAALAAIVHAESHAAFTGEWPALIWLW